MGKYMRECKGIGDLAVMEVSQMVGVRTRARTLALAAAAAAAAGSSSKRRNAAAPAGELQYLQLRNRNLVMTPRRITRSPPKSGSGRRRPSPELGPISRCSSNASCEVEGLRSQSCDPEGCEGLETALCFSECSSHRREMAPSSDGQDASGDLESTAERKTTETASESEIEEFFAAAERAEKRRFADTYNYDVDNDVPLDGRYEWVRLNP